MIFLTIGTHEPFDRLVEAVDDWCRDRRVGGRVFGQITKNARYTPASFDWVPSLDPVDYLYRFREADLVISHAGMGTIITALELAKPLVLMPRRAHLGETRNDHQVGTAERFGAFRGIYPASHRDELMTVLDRLAHGEEIDAALPIRPYADVDLTSALRTFIFERDVDV